MRVHTHLHLQLHLHLHLRTRLRLRLRISISIRMHVHSHKQSCMHTYLMSSIQQPYYRLHVCSLSTCEQSHRIERQRMLELSLDGRPEEDCLSAYAKSPY